VLDAIEAHGITKMFLVPAAIQFILQQPQSRTADLSSLRCLIYGAAPITLPVLEEALAVFKCEFVQLYGLTETTAQTTYLPPQDHQSSDTHRLRSAGKPLPYIDVKVVNPEGTILAPNEIGEICIKSPSNMLGYWKLPDATNDTMRDGWVYTGDAGYKDDDGYLYICDRIKDMIVSGGENIYPAEIESAIMGHPDIVDVAVIGIPDEKWGESVKAVVVLKADTSLSPSEIIDFAKTRIASFKVPKSVDFIEMLPRNAAGKILKKDLRAPYWEGKQRMVN
jgi:long-chain acyl-CoA synthetase